MSLFDELRFCPDEASTLPKFRQLARAIEHFLREKHFAVGTKLPNDRKLAAQLGTTPVTLSRALNELAEAGVLSRRVGAGTFVGGSAAPHRIGVICHEMISWNDLYVGTVLGAFYEYFQERDVSVLSLQGRPEQYEKLMADYRLTGLLVLVPEEEFLSSIERMRRNGVPVVTIGYAPEKCREFAFGTDHEKAGEDAVDYLVGLGHERIGVIYADVPRASEIRRRGYAQGMWRHRLPVRPDWEIPGDEIEERICRLFAEKDPPSALIVTLSFTLPRLYICLAGLGKKIPQDVSVVCFDDPGFRQMLRPVPTVFVQLSAEFATLAATRLEAMMNGERDFVPVPFFSSELVERDSTRAID